MYELLCGCVGLATSYLHLRKTKHAVATSDHRIALAAIADLTGNSKKSTLLRCGYCTPDDDLLFPFEVCEGSAVRSGARSNQSEYLLHRLSPVDSPVFRSPRIRSQDVARIRRLHFRLSRACGDCIHSLGEHFGNRRLDPGPDFTYVCIGRQGKAATSVDRSGVKLGLHPMDAQADIRLSGQYGPIHDGIAPKTWKVARVSIEHTMRKRREHRSRQDGKPVDGYCYFALRAVEASDVLGMTDVNVVHKIGTDFAGQQPKAFGAGHCIVVIVRTCPHEGNGMAMLLKAA